MSGQVSSCRVLTEIENIDSEFRSFQDRSNAWMLICTAILIYVLLLDIFIKTPEAVYNFLMLAICPGFLSFFTNAGFFRKYTEDHEKYNWRFEKSLKLYSLLETAQIIYCIGLFGFILPALWSGSKVVGKIGMVLCFFGLVIIIASPLYALYLQKNKLQKLNPNF